MGQNDNNRGLPDRAVLTIRLIIGGYLLYIDYQIFDDVMRRQGISKYVMIAFMILFALAGSILIVLSIKGLFRSEEPGQKTEEAPEAEDHDENQKSS